MPTPPRKLVHFAFFFGRVLCLLQMQLGVSLQCSRLHLSLEPQSESRGNVNRSKALETPIDSTVKDSIAVSEGCCAVSVEFLLKGCLIGESKYVLLNFWKRRLPGNAE